MKFAGQSHRFALFVALAKSLLHRSHFAHIDFIYCCDDIATLPIANALGHYYVLHIRVWVAQSVQYFAANLRWCDSIVFDRLSLYVGNCVLDINKFIRYLAIGCCWFLGQYSYSVFIMSMVSDYAACEYQSSLLRVFSAISAVAYLLDMLSTHLVLKGHRGCIAIRTGNIHGGPHLPPCTFLRLRRSLEVRFSVVAIRRHCPRSTRSGRALDPNYAFLRRLASP